jgi:dolichol-phosphate mannosyltransferase
MKTRIENSGPSTLVLIAALNEEEGILPTISEIREFVSEPSILVVDGRSVDGTAKVAEALGAQVIFQKGLGKGDAMATALAHIRLLRPKYMVLIDADFTYPAEYLPHMISILEENPSVGMVCGNRFNHHLSKRAMHNAFYFGNRLLAFTHNVLNGVTMRDPLTGLRVMRWEILKDWTPKSKNFDIEVELNHHVERRGYGIREIDIKYRPRLGEKKLKLKHGVTILKRIMSESIY